jgi:succinate dehydrogenase / fumarate reductase, membrane anchor subunit
MVRNILALTSSGVRDWLIQRVTAVVIFVYLAYVSYFVISNTPVSYQAWQQLAACTWMQVGSSLVLLAIVWHAWIGLWTVFTDYVKCSCLRIVLQTSVIITLLGCFVWGLKIVWSV